MCEFYEVPIPLPNSPEITGLMLVRFSHVSFVYYQGVPVRPLHRHNQRDSHVHGMPSGARARECSATAATPGQKVLRHRRAPVY